IEIKENEVYTHEETQKLLKVSSSTITRMIKKGLIRTARVGKQYRIMGKELLRVLSPRIEDKVGKDYNKARNWAHKDVGEDAKPKKKKKRPVFIIAEAGSNWKVGSSAADWKRARALVDTAKEAGADAVKFQTFRASSVYVPNAGVSAYLSKQGIRESIVGLFERLSMPYEMIPKLAAYCRKQKMEFMSSFFSADDFKIVNPWVWRHKIASYEIT